jgi:hypothetical protein
LPAACSVAAVAAALSLLPCCACLKRAATARALGGDTQQALEARRATGAATPRCALQPATAGRRHCMRMLLRAVWGAGAVATSIGSGCAAVERKVFACMRRVSSEAARDVKSGDAARYTPHTRQVPHTHSFSSR